MKIALLTIWQTSNYGAELQAYATIKALKLLGHAPKIIDLRLKSPKFALRSLLQIPKLFKFWLFRKRHIRPKTRRYRDGDDLAKTPPLADVFLVGSDQVWNPEITRDIAPAFFLPFVAADTTRVSYASSFGVDSWSANATLDALARKEFAKFNYLSTRELTGQNILDQEFNMKSECVLDPTLLFDDYTEITGKIQPKNEIICYKFKLENEFYELGRTVSQELKRPIRLLNSSRKIRGFEHNFQPGIKQWLTHFAAASFVITDSFHGVAFSIVFRRNFIVLVANEKRITRVQNLLIQLGLEDRLFLNYDQIYRSKPWMQKIDYSKIEAKLALLRSISWGFLSKIAEK